MTLDQRRRRLRLGVGICAVFIAAFVVAAIAGVERHITLLSSMPLWPALAVLVGQWVNVNGKIAVHGPDQLEEHRPVSRKALVGGIGAMVVVLAIGGFVAMRVAASAVGQ